MKVQPPIPSKTDTIKPEKQPIDVVKQKMANFINKAKTESKNGRVSVNRGHSYNLNDKIITTPFIVNNSVRNMQDASDGTITLSYTDNNDNEVSEEFSLKGAKKEIANKEGSVGKGKGSDGSAPVLDLEGEDVYFREGGGKNMSLDNAKDLLSQLDSKKKYVLTLGEPYKHKWVGSPKELNADLNAISRNLGGKDGFTIKPAPPSAY